MSDQITKNKPVDVVRDGNLKVAIWRNETPTEFRYSTGKVVRSFKDNHGNWQEAEYLSNGEILRASYLLAKAYERQLEFKVADYGDYEGNGTTE